MPLEVKNIYFSESEVRTALVNFSILNQHFIDVDDIEKIVIDKADAVRVLMIVKNTAGLSKNELFYSSAQVGAALMAFCMVSKIPLPKKGFKVLEADNNKLSLRITLDQDVDFEDYIISRRITNSYRRRG